MKRSPLALSVLTGIAMSGYLHLTRDAAFEQGADIGSAEMIPFIHPGDLANLNTFAERMPALER